jgi:MFS family permease
MINNTHGPSTTETTPGPTQDANMDSYGRKAVFASSIGYGLDGFDLLILSFALSGIMATFHLTDTEAGALTTLTLLGAVLGGIVVGILADRFGRVRMLTYSVILFAVFTGLSALATGYTDLAICRFIAGIGIGIGGEFGIGMTLAAEAVPARMRARATSWVALGFQFGVLAAALLFAPIITAFGWRGLFVVGAFPAVVAVIIRKPLHESPKFLEKAANVDLGVPKVRGNSLRLLVGNKKAVRVTIALIILTSVQNFGYFGIMSWLPRYLSTQFHLNLTNSSIWTRCHRGGHDDRRHRLWTARRQDRTPQDVLDLPDRRRCLRSGLQPDHRSRHPTGRRLHHGRLCQRNARRLRSPHG